MVLDYTMFLGALEWFLGHFVWAKFLELVYPTYISCLCV